MGCFPCTCIQAPPWVDLGLLGSQALTALIGCGLTPRPEGTILASLCPQTCSEQHRGCLCPAALTGCPGHHLRALMGPCCHLHSYLGPGCHTQPWVCLAGPTSHQLQCQNPTGRWLGIHHADKKENWAILIKKKKIRLDVFFLKGSQCFICVDWLIFIKIEAMLEVSVWACAVPHRRKVNVEAGVNNASICVLVCFIMVFNLNKSLFSDNFCV